MMAVYRRFRVRNAFMTSREDLYEKLIEELEKDGAKRNDTISAMFTAWALREAKRNKWLASAYASIANKLNNEGGTLSAALRNLIPFEEQMVIWGGEQQGHLVESVKHALRIKLTLEEMKANSRAALTQPLHGAINVFVTAALLGSMVWPDLTAAIPLQFYPEWARPSIAFDLWFARNWAVLGIIAPLLYAYFHYLPRWTGRSRQFFDRIYPWATYREEQANVLLTTLAGLLGSGFTITHACEEIRKRSTPYLRWHLNRITPQLQVISDNALKAFDTGLISRSVLDRLEDAKRTRDMDRTIQHVGDKSLAAMVRIAKRNAENLSLFATTFFIVVFLYSAAVQLIGTQDASDAFAAKVQRSR